MVIWIRQKVQLWIWKADRTAYVRMTASDFRSRRESEVSTVFAFSSRPEVGRWPSDVGGSVALFSDSWASCSFDLVWFKVMTQRSWRTTRPVWSTWTPICLESPPNGRSSTASRSLTWDSQLYRATPVWRSSSTRPSRSRRLAPMMPCWSHVTTSSTWSLGQDHCQVPQLINSVLSSIFHVGPG